MTDQNERIPPNAPVPEEPAFAALGVLLTYLFVQVRLRDGVPMPPLFDRTDFLKFVQLHQDAPAAQWTEQQRQGHAWLAQQMEKLCAQ